MHSAELKLVLLLGFLTLQPSLATDPKPDAAIKTRAIEANVFLDNQIKADPALAADCLAEGNGRIFGGTQPKGDAQEN
jgi:hypothetical protein